MNKPQLIQKVEKNKTDLGTVLDRGFVDTVWHGGFTEEEWNTNRDWNRVIKNGYYRANSWDTEEKNLPNVSKFGSQIGTLVVTNVSNTIHQEFTTPNGIFFRSSGDNGVTWKEWEKIATVDQLKALSDSSLNVSEVTMPDNTDWFTLGIGAWSVNLNINTCTNTPQSIGATSKGTLVVFKSYKQDSEWGGYTYIYTCSTGMYICNRYDKATNLQWSKVATTDKIDISCTPNTGFSVVRQKSYQINNILYVDVLFKNTDGTSLAKALLNPFKLPSGGILTHKNIPFTTWINSGASMRGSGGISTIRSDGQVYLLNDVSEAITEIQVCGAVVLEV